MTFFAVFSGCSLWWQQKRNQFSKYGIVLSWRLLGFYMFGVMKTIAKPLVVIFFFERMNQITLYLCARKTHKLKNLTTMSTNNSALNEQQGTAQPTEFVNRVSNQAITPLLDLPSAATPGEREEAMMVLELNGFIDKEGHPVNNPYEGGSRYRVRHQVSIKALLAAGKIPVFIEQSRPVASKHIDALKQDLIDHGETVFKSAAKITWASRILSSEEGLTLKTFDGQPVTRETENIDDYFVVNDGKPRLCCCIEDPSLDLLVELADYDGNALELDLRVNSVVKTYSASDYSAAIVAKNPGAATVLEEANKLSETFSISSSCAQFTIARAKFRRADYVDGFLGGPEALAKFKCPRLYTETAWRVMGSIKIAAHGDRNVEKKLKSSEFLSALVELISAGKKNIEANIAPYLAQLKPSILDEFVGLIDRKDRMGLKAKLTKDYNVFVKSHSEEELVELRKQNNEEIEVLKAKMTGQVHKPKTTGYPPQILALRKGNMTRAKKQRKPKSGSPSEILAIRREEAV